MLFGILFYIFVIKKNKCAKLKEYIYIYIKFVKIYKLLSVIDNLINSHFLSKRLNRIKRRKKNIMTMEFITKLYSTK